MIKNCDFHWTGSKCLNSCKRYTSGSRCGFNLTDFIGSSERWQSRDLRRVAYNAFDQVHSVQISLQRTEPSPVVCWIQTEAVFSALNVPFLIWAFIPFLSDPGRALGQATLHLSYYLSGSKLQNLSWYPSSLRSKGFLYSAFARPEIRLESSQSGLIGTVIRGEKQEEADNPVPNSFRFKSAIITENMEPSSKP